MPPHRDVAAFVERAPHYDQGWLGRLHHDIAERAAALSLAGGRHPTRVLDLGCGTGHLLRTLADSCPAGCRLVGVDPAATMLEVAASAAVDGRQQFARASAEHLPFADHAFDLVVSTTSFDHWSDQLAGLRECARVLEPGGRLVLVDQFSLLLAPTLVGSRRHKARTRRRASALLRAAGFPSATWHDLYAVIIKAVIAPT